MGRLDRLLTKWCLYDFFLNKSDIQNHKHKSNIILMDVRLVSFHHYLRYFHKLETIVFGTHSVFK